MGNPRTSNGHRILLELQPAQPFLRPRRRRRIHLPQRQPNRYLGQLQQNRLLRRKGLPLEQPQSWLVKGWMRWVRLRCRQARCRDPHQRAQAETSSSRSWQAQGARSQRVRLSKYMVRYYYSPSTATIDFPRSIIRLKDTERICADFRMCAFLVSWISRH